MAWGLEAGARCQVPVAGRIQVGRRELLGRSGPGSTTESVTVNGDGHGPRMVPQLWECGLHWTVSIGNNGTDARGWNWALDAAMDGRGLVEVGAEVNGSSK